MIDVEWLLTQAENYRRMAGNIGDQKASAALLELAQEYEMQARKAVPEIEGENSHSSHDAIGVRSEE